MNTNRLTITFKDKKVAADIEPNISFEDALNEITKAINNINNGDFEVVNFSDEDLETQNIDDFVKEMK